MLFHRCFLRICVWLVDRDLCTKAALPKLHLQHGLHFKADAACKAFFCLHSGFIPEYRVGWKKQWGVKDYKMNQANSSPFVVNTNEVYSPSGNFLFWSDQKGFALLCVDSLKKKIVSGRVSSVERRPLHASTMRVPMAGCKPAPKHVLEPPDRCPRVPGRHCCFQTNPGSCAALPSHGWLCAGPSAKGWNSSCSVKSDKCLMSDRETTLTSHGSLPFNQSVVLQPSADTFLWGNVELFCTESFTLFVFCLIFSHHKEFFDP